MANQLIDKASGFPYGTWYRTCQECGHKQLDREPARDKELTSTYRNRKCRRCYSESLDYGTTGEPNNE